MVGPFYYEQYLKDRYANGESGRQCFDVLRASVVYDFGRAMQFSGIGAEGFWRPCFWTGSTKTFVNTFEANFNSSSSIRNKNLQDILDAYAEYKNN